MTDNVDLYGRKGSYIFATRQDIRLEAVHMFVDHPQRFLKCFFKLSADSHDLSYAFHGTSNLSIE